MAYSSTPTLTALGASAPAVSAGQLWLAAETGGYWFAPNLSKYLREQVQRRCRFRQFCDLPDDTQNAQKAGDTFHWNIYGDAPDTVGGEIAETDDIPMMRIEAAQGSCVVTEFAAGIPYSGKLDDLAEHPVKEIIKKKLESHCARRLDTRAYQQFAKTLVKVGPGGAGFNDATTISLTETGVAPGINNAALAAAHVSEIALTMRERDIPSYDHGDYYAVARPSAYRVVKKDLESIHKYTESGFQLIRDGEKGRYEGVRMVEQTNIPVSTDFADNNKSDEVFFFGEDAVAECTVIPEEIRSQIPTDFGRKKAIAWYYLGNFAPTRLAAADTRVLHWTSLTS